MKKLIFSLVSMLALAVGTANACNPVAVNANYGCGNANVAANYNANFNLAVVHPVNNHVQVQLVRTVTQYAPQTVTLIQAQAYQPQVQTRTVTKTVTKTISH